MTNQEKELAAALRGTIKEQQALRSQMAKLVARIDELESRPRSLEDELNSIPGRRIFYKLTQIQDFTVTQDGQAGPDMTFQVSQDGPFIMTHEPFVVWRPNAPATATNFGRWRPVSSWPLPDQVLDTDLIDLSYSFKDGGSQRNFDNMPAGPVFSRPDALVPLPCPTLFAPNSAIVFQPFYENILFDGAAEVPTTGGRLKVTLLGIRIVNL